MQLQTITQTTSLKYLSYRKDIDGLRALAIFSVIGFHAFPNWLAGGFIGVDIFFVISGFLISTIIFQGIEDNKFSFFDFYSRRIKRIFPALFLVLIANFIFGWFVLLPDEYKQLGKYIMGGAGFISNFLLWNDSGYFDNAAETKPLLHLWSLGIEEQFYIVWPMLLWLIGRQRFDLLIIVVISSLSFLLNISIVNNDAVAAFYSPQTRFWELLTGSFLAHIILHKKKYHRQIYISFLQHTHLEHILSLLGIVLIAISLVCINKGLAFPGWWAILPVFGTVLIILAGEQIWFNRVILSNKILVWFGLISFPLYLWHWSLLSFLRIMESQAPSDIARIVAILISIILAWFTYEIVEKPVRFGSSGEIKTIILLGLMIFAGYTGYYLNEHDGFIFKIKPIVLATINNQLVEHKKTSNKTELERYEEAFSTNPNYIQEIEERRQQAIRAPFCHMNKPGQLFEEYMLGIDKCLDIKTNKPNILIMGDSHAADLYAALVNTHANINFLQATGASCTPIRTKHIATSNQADRCKKLINYAIKFAKLHKINAVILAARWPNDFENVLNEVNELRSSGNKTIIVGASLEYTEDVYKLIARRDTHVELKYYSEKFINMDKLSLNLRMSKFSNTYNLSYIDRIALYCAKENICPLISPSGELYIVDYGHLSLPGAMYLGNQLLISNVIMRFLEETKN